MPHAFLRVEVITRFSLFRVITMLIFRFATCRRRLFRSFTPIAAYFRFFFCCHMPYFRYVFFLPPDITYARYLPRHIFSFFHHHHCYLYAHAAFHDAPPTYVFFFFFFHALSFYITYAMSHACLFYTSRHTRYAHAGAPRPRANMRSARYRRAPRSFSLFSRCASVSRVPPCYGFILPPPYDAFFDV